MASSSRVCSELNEQVRSLHKALCDQVNEQMSLAMQSRPRTSLMYQDFAERFMRGVEACDQYFETSNLLELVREFNNWGFFDEQLSLKNYTTDSEILNTIAKNEQSFKC